MSKYFALLLINENSICFNICTTSIILKKLDKSFVIWAQTRSHRENSLCRPGPPPPSGLSIDALVHTFSSPSERPKSSNRSDAEYVDSTASYKLVIGFRVDTFFVRAINGIYGSAKRLSSRISDILHYFFPSMISASILSISLLIAGSKASMTNA